jgi:carbohydrate kinase (thermoresistant glucokinase family)
MASHPLVVLMGVAGSGKSTVGPRLADALGVEFVDGDDVHSDAAKAQMAAGEPLTDDQREPWLDRLHQILAAHVGDGAVLACSALKSSYRQHLVGELEHVVFIALVAPPEQLAARLEARPDHFAGPELLVSQLDALELDDGIAVVDSTQSVGAVTAAARRVVETGGRDPSA